MPPGVNLLQEGAQFTFADVVAFEGGVPIVN